MPIDKKHAWQIRPWLTAMLPATAQQQANNNKNCKRRVKEKIWAKKKPVLSQCLIFFPRGGVAVVCMQQCLLSVAKATSRTNQPLLLQHHIFWLRDLPETTTSCTSHTSCAASGGSVSGDCTTCMQDEKHQGGAHKTEK